MSRRRILAPREKPLFESFLCRFSAGVPVAKFSHKLKLPTRILSGVALLAQLLCELVDVQTERTLAFTVKCMRIFEKSVLHKNSQGPAF